MADNSSENAPIGFKAPPLKVEVRKAAVGVGKAVPKAVAKVVEETISARNASLAPVKAKVRFALKEEPTLEEPKEEPSMPTLVVNELEKAGYEIKEK